MPRGALDPDAVRALTARLSDVDARRAARHPGDHGGRQPVHTCYVPAGQVGEDLVLDWGSRALAALREHAGTPGELAAVLDLPDGLAPIIHTRIAAKLAAEPIEDLRIDFEDGYGAPGDDTEDADAERTALIVAGWHRDGVAPPHLGLRMKSFDTAALRDRGIRTLDVFLSTLLAAGPPPPGLVVTFPKVTAVEQVEVLVEVLALLESRLGLRDGALRFEVQVETTQSIVDDSGRLALPGFITAGRGRVTGLHFGTYDYTAGCGLGAAHQHLAHGACDFARHVMQVSAAGTGVRLSDGSTIILPVGDASAVRHGWRTHFDLVRRSLEHGFYQGWDLHPAQLVTRYAAVHAYYLRGAEADARRLTAYVAKAGGGILDEPATAQALSTSFLRALDCGALDPAEVQRVTGLSRDELRALAKR
ncbi:aldolase [Solihabitans fulvus]|uniref:Aldolase n=1 Tax=Solihabitans fulvus TaxID=1892852 RepID=A0A5B2WS50_9PSEU|nr:aldolase [Solihabitans fulvus]KAA2253630.1 aldolase [Solihabitans fulvus]